mmetsp:Transcript_35181/g.48808  ORF Transcript_35181/g.48808 Transcript_35181/m.48808 type:complete len:757 (+) Transcript_35181:86-2356(+)
MVVDDNGSSRNFERSFHGNQSKIRERSTDGWYAPPDAPKNIPLTSQGEGTSLDRDDFFIENTCISSPLIQKVTFSGSKTMVTEEINELDSITARLESSSGLPIRLRLKKNAAKLAKIARSCSFDENNKFKGSSISANMCVTVPRNWSSNFSSKDNPTPRFSKSNSSHMSSDTKKRLDKFHIGSFPLDRRRKVHKQNRSPRDSQDVLRGFADEKATASVNATSGKYPAVRNLFNNFPENDLQKIRQKNGPMENQESGFEQVKRNSGGVSDALLDLASAALDGRSSAQEKTRGRGRPGKRWQGQHDEDSVTGSMDAGPQPKKKRGRPRKNVVSNTQTHDERKPKAEHWKTKAKREEERNEKLWTCRERVSPQETSPTYKWDAQDRDLEEKKLFSQRPERFERSLPERPDKPERVEVSAMAAASLVEGNASSGNSFSSSGREKKNDEEIRPSLPQWMVADRMLTSNAIMTAMEEERRMAEKMARNRKHLTVEKRTDAEEKGPSLAGDQRPPSFSKRVNDREASNLQEDDERMEARMNTSASVSTEVKHNGSFINENCERVRNGGSPWEATTRIEVGKSESETRRNEASIEHRPHGTNENDFDAKIQLQTKNKSDEAMMEVDRVSDVRRSAWAEEDEQEEGEEEDEMEAEMAERRRKMAGEPSDGSDASVDEGDAKVRDEGRSEGWDSPQGSPREPQSPSIPSEDDGEDGADEALARALHREMNCTPARTTRTERRRTKPHTTPPYDQVFGNDPGLLPSC